MNIRSRAVIAGLAALLLTPRAASAVEMWQYLYINRDNKGWIVERAYSTPAQCDAAAREAVRSKRALGAACSADVQTTREEDAKAARAAAARQQQQAPVQAEDPKTLSGYEAAKKRQEDRRQQVQEAVQKANQETRALEAERDRVRAFTGQAPCSGDPRQRGCGTILVAPDVPKDPYWTSPYGK
jgi:hypothetical protein